MFFVERWGGFEAMKTIDSGIGSATECLPTFLLIGAAKSATTSLADYLAQHPECFVPPKNKEPNYFALAGEKLPHRGPASDEVLNALWYSHCITDFESYRRLFDGEDQTKARGEASVRYLYYPETAHRIHAILPDARLVVVLREPVSRLYSHYSMNVQYQLEPLSLEDALAAEDDRVAAGWGWDWHYRRIGRYAEQLKRYLDIFDREQIRVFLFDDFSREPLRVFQEICRHIGVDDHFVPDMSYRGKSAYRPRHLALDRWLHWPRAIRPGWERLVPRRLPRRVVSWLENWNSLPIPRMDRDLRQSLRSEYESEVRELEELIGQPTHWYE